MTKAEHAHLERIKSMPCGVCRHSAPSDAHHILDNGRRIGHFVTIPLCKDCHQDGRNGIHGRATMWRVMKKTELSVLNDTIARLN